LGEHAGAVVARVGEDDGSRTYLPRDVDFGLGKGSEELERDHLLVVVSVDRKVVT
jgi:hypothetical protein